MTYQLPFLIKIQNQVKCKGFSLIEVLVAITVLIVGLVGVVGLIVYNISISRASPEKVIAVNLAQEGIEVVRNIRDSNWLAGNDWKENIKGTGNEKTGRIEYNNVGGLKDYENPPPADVFSCNPSCQLYLKNGVYSHDNTGTSTNFYRLIILDKIPPVGNQEIKIECQVGWYDSNGISHTVTLEDHLYDWAK